MDSRHLLEHLRAKSTRVSDLDAGPAPKQPSAEQPQRTRRRQAQANVEQATGYLIQTKPPYPRIPAEQPRPNPAAIAEIRLGSGKAKQRNQAGRSRMKAGTILAWLRRQTWGWRICEDCKEAKEDAKERRFARAPLAFLYEFGIDLGADTVVLCDECYIRREAPSYYDW